MRRHFMSHAGFVWTALVSMLAGDAAAAQQEQIFTLFQFEKRIGKELFTLTDNPADRSIAVHAEAKIDLPYRSVAMTQELVVEAGSFALRDYRLTAAVGDEPQSIRAWRDGDSVIVELSASGTEFRRGFMAPGEVLILDNMLMNHMVLLGMRTAARGFRQDTVQVIVPQVGALIPALVLPSDPATDGSRSIEVQISSVVEKLHLTPSGAVDAVEIPSQAFSYRKEELGLPETLEPRRELPPLDRASVPEGVGRPTRALFEEQPVEVVSNGTALGGILTLPRGGQHIPYPSVLFVHGSGPQDRDETTGPNRPFYELAHGLAVYGIASLRYDKRTLVAPRTTPPLQVTVQGEVIDDALAALQFLRSRVGIDSRRIWIVGHSLGGCLAPAIARVDGGVAGLVVLAGSLRPLDLILRDQIAFLSDLARRDGSLSPGQEAGARVLLAQLDSLAMGNLPPARLILGMSGRYLSDYRGRDLAADFVAFQGPVLVLRGGKDYQITQPDIDSWKEAASRAGKKNLAIREYPELGHLFIPIKGEPTPAALLVPGNVDPTAIQEIANFIQSRDR